MTSFDSNASCDDMISDNGNSDRPFVIGVCGGTSSGKSTVCSKIMEKLNQDSFNNDRVLCISQESFYKPLTEEQRSEAMRGDYDFDHPDALDAQLMKELIEEIIDGKTVKLPIWNFITHSRKEDEFITVSPPDVLLVEGILVFWFPEIRELFQMKLFVDTDADTRLSRRVIRDVRDYHRELGAVLNHYTHYVKPAFEEFCQPTKKYADVIIPRGPENEVAIDLIVQTIKDYHESDRNSQFASRVARRRYLSGSFLSPSPSPDACIISTSPTYYG
ncbi:uridine-cytidine kinase [Brevipalpus obovatus]|uniref:uridine-cytidine kinase n=1 Tax=Brevipalpus obovatus TaxID=246614 RepID=UPI003D9DEF8E